MKKTGTLYERFAKGEWLMLSARPAKYVGSGKAVIYRDSQECEFVEIVSVNRLPDVNDAVAVDRESQPLSELTIPLSGFVAEVDYRVRRRLGEIGERLGAQISSDLSNLRFDGFLVKGIFPDFRSEMVDKWWVLVDEEHSMKFRLFDIAKFSIVTESRKAKCVNQPIKINDKPLTKGDFFVEINHRDEPQLQFVLDVLKVLEEHYVLLYNKETNTVDLRGLHDSAWKPAYIREATIEEINEFFEDLECQLGSMKGKVAIINDRMILVPDYGNPIRISDVDRQNLELAGYRRN